MRTLIAIRCLMTGLAVACLFDQARALDPNRQTSQYVREQWSTRGGLLEGAVHAIAQTPDGYLWIGTDKGLVRFDGFNFSPVVPGSSVLQNDPILGLVTDGDGVLWVRMQAAGVLRYSHGKFRWNSSVFSRVALPPSVGKPQVLTIVRDRDSNIWVGTTAGLLRIKAGGFSFSDEQGFRGNGAVEAIFEDREGNLWIGGSG